MARMMGKDPAYARPMDAGDEVRGPLVRIVFLGLVCYETTNICILYTPL